MDFLSSFPTVIRNRISVIFGVFILAASIYALPPQPTLPSDISALPSSSINEDIRVECANRHMIIHIMTGSSENRKYFEEPSEDVFTDDENLLNFETHDNDIFNGLVYPKGLSRNSSCMAEYINQHDPIIYKLPLRSCNTMSSETEDGAIEYFNTIVVQPHLKLVTNQGRGFHIRCKYETPEKMITYKGQTGKRPSTDPISLPSIADLPRVSMKIFRNDPEKKRIQSVAENVKIGDPLAIVVEVEPSQNDFGIKVADCLVKDGLGWGEQRLTSDKGCPIDDEIMGLFAYNSNKTRAEVHFQAHKFPYTQSVYYQCNVKFCLKHNDQCQDFWNLPCGTGGRLKRQSKDTNDGIPATIEVFSGLYVNEANDLSKLDRFDDVIATKNPEDSICVSQKTFAIAISIAGLILMLCVVLAIICILARRRTKKTSSVPGSSIYSGPYTNTAYSHTS